MGEYIRNNTTNKLELHFDKSEYQALTDEEKKNIKSAFLFSRYQKIWISRGKYPSYSYKRALEIAQAINLDDGGEEGEKLSFAEQMEVKADKAERRAEKYDYKSEKAYKDGKQLQKPIEDKNGDIAFFTQPNINTSSGRAFTNRRNKMWSMWEKGFEEYKKSEYYAERAETARRTAAQTKPTDKAFCERRIKECESSIRKLKKSIEEYENYIQQIEEGKTPTNKYGWEVKTTIESCKNNIERWEELAEIQIDKASYYYECLEELGGIKFSKDNINVGDIVNIKKWGRAIKVTVTSTGKVNIKYTENDPRGWSGQCSYADILEVVEKADTEKILHPFKIGEVYKVSHTVYDSSDWNNKGRREEKEYKVTKITKDKVTFKCGNERAVTKKPYRFINSNMICFSVSLLNDYRTGNAVKTISIEEAELMGI